MPIISCPQCAAKLNVNDELLGKNGKCPKCAAVFVMTADALAETRREPIAPAPIDPPPPNPVQAMPPFGGIGRVSPVSAEPMPAEREVGDFGRDDDDDFDGRDIAQSNALERWSTCRTGFQMFFWSFIAFLAFIIISQAVQIALFASMGDDFRQPANPRAPGMMIFSIVTMGIGCLTIIAGIVNFIGIIMVCLAPDKTTSRRAILAIVCTVVGVLLGIVVFVALVISIARDLGGAGAGADQVLLERILRSGVLGIGGLVLAGGLCLAGWVFWLMVHVAIANAVDRPDLRSSTFTYMAGFFVLYPISVTANWGIGRVLNDNPFAPSPQGMIVRGLVGIVFMCLLWGWYLMLCRKTIRAISRP